MFIKKRLALISENIKREFNVAKWAFCIVLTLALIIVSVIQIASTRKCNTYSVDFSAIKSTVDPDGTAHLELHGISLRKGSYDFEVGYVSDSAARMDISLENDNFLSVAIPETGASGSVVSKKMDIRKGTDRGKINFTYPEGAAFNLAYITISSDKPLYYDGIMIGILLLLLIPCVWAGVYFWCRSTHKISLLVALGLVILQMIPFVMRSGLNLGIDTRAHMMRIEGVYYGLLDGQFPVVIYPEWNNSYGQLGVLYPNLFLYIPAVFRLMGMSQLGAIKVFMFLLIAGSTVIALASARSIFRREWQITMTLVIICLDDMRLQNMLSDGRIGGAVIAELFYPLVVAGLIEIFYHNRKKWYLLAYGMAGIFCCHIMTASLVCIAVALFTLFVFGKLKDIEILRALGRAILLFAGLVLGTMAMFLKFYFSDWGRDNLQWEDFISTLFPRGRFLDDVRWSYIIILLVLCITALVIVAVRKNISVVRNTYVIPLLCVGTILFLMSTSVFPWTVLKKIPAVDYYMNMIQDSYRFLTLVTCFLAFCLPRLLETVVVSVAGRHSYESRTTILSCVITGLLCFAGFLLSDYEYLFMYNQTLYYDAVIGDMEYQAEDYLPAGTQSEWYESDTGDISDQDAVSSLAYERDGTYVYYAYTNTKEGAYVEFPRFYYDGYVAKDEMSEDLEVVKGEKNRTRVYLKVTDTPSIVRMWYYVPWYLTLAVSVSMGLWIGSLMIVLVRLHYRVDGVAALYVNKKTGDQQHAT